MPDRYVRFARIPSRGRTHEGLTAYVLTEYLRSENREFGVFETAMDMTTTDFRMELRAVAACEELLDLEPDYHGAIGRDLRDRVEGEFGQDYILSRCDRDRMLDYLDSLTGADRAALGSLILWPSPANFEKIGARYPSLKTTEKLFAARKQIVDKMFAIVKERVKVKVISKGRVIAMAQATGGDGAPLEVRRYKGGTDLAGVIIGQCALEESGLVIIRKMSGNIPPNEKVTEVKNELTGHVLVLTATQDTTPKGEERAVKKIKKDETLTLTGRDHRKSWIVSVEDEAEDDEAEDAA